MKTLLAQIYEGGVFHQNAITQKRGLFNALRLYGDVLDWDYLANDAATRYEGMVNRIEQFQPDLVFTQFHAADVITPEQMRGLRERYPNITFVNWSGDSWAWSLTAPDILELARQYDLWLVCAPDVLPTYVEHGIRAEFMQIAYEPPVVPLPDMPAYDVVFLGNVISEKRRALLEMLREWRDFRFNMKIGIYGDWEHADGQNTYDFAAGEALYKNATLAIADCAYPDAQNYISNRPFHVLAAGGAVLLHQHVPKMYELSRMKAGQHFIEWHDLDDLRALIVEWLLPKHRIERRLIAAHGREFVLRNHTWNDRARALVEEWLPSLQRIQA